MTDKKFMYRVGGQMFMKCREVVKVTDKTVTFINESGNPDRERLKGVMYQWFNTQQEAIDYITERQLLQIERGKKMIENAQRVIDNLPKTTTNE